MTRLNIILSFLLLCTWTFGQNDSTKIYGWVVVDTRVERKFIKNADIKLYYKNFIYETSSDSNGYYSFNINKRLDSVILKVQINKTTTTGIKSDRLFVPTQTTTKLTTTTKNPLKHIIELKISTGCGSLPSIYFNFNSTKLVIDTIDALIVISSVLKDNPNIIAEISAHCDVREKDILSHKRADFIISELVNKGINPERLISKGYGSIQPLITADIIKRAKTTEDKELLYQINRRANIRILSFDFNDK